MRHRAAWFLALPLAAIGTLAGHSVAYRTAVPDAHERGRVLASSGHGYLDYAPVVVGVCVAAAGLAFAGAALLAFLGRSRAATTEAKLVAAVPPLAFVVQELVERYVHDGHIHWNAVLSTPFLVGLAAQVPLALLVASLAFALTRVAEEFGLALGHRPPGWAFRVTQRFVRPADLPLRPALSRGYSGRGPPLRP